MSHVLDIRSRTAQERLRGDHIELLFLLETANEENDNLWTEVKRLEGIIADMSKGVKGSTNSVPPESTVESTTHSCGHDGEIDSLQSQVSSLQNEVKTLRSSKSLTEKSHMRLLQDHAKQSDEQSRRTEEHTAQLTMQVEDIRSLAARELASSFTQPACCNECSSYKAKIEDLMLAVESGKSQLTKLRNESKIQTSSYELDMQRLTSIMDAKTERISQLEKELDQATRSYEDLRNVYSKVVASTKKKMERPPRPVTSTRQQDATTQTTSLPLLQNSSSQSPSLDSEICATTRSSLSEIEEDTSKEHGSFSFEEFIRLKRENVSLKLQLAGNSTSVPAITKKGNRSFSAGRSTRTPRR